MSEQDRISPTPDAVFTRLSDTSGTVLNLRNKRYYTLNETGLRIWELMESEGSLAKIASALTKEFEIEHDAAVDRVREFADDLRSEGLVEVG